MKVLPTMEGGLRVDLAEEADWAVFQMLLDDARGKSKDWLAKRLGVLMEDDDWDEYVVPDLAEFFGEQAALVNQALQDAEKKADGLNGELYISREDGQAWYSILNQARLALEGQWKLAEVEGLESEEGEAVLLADQQRLSALMRSRLYLLLQTRLLEFVLD